MIASSEDQQAALRLAWHVQNIFVSQRTMEESQRAVSQLLASGETLPADFPLKIDRDAIRWPAPRYVRGLTERVNREPWAAALLNGSEFWDARRRASSDFAAAVGDCTLRLRFWFRETLHDHLRSGDWEIGRDVLRFLHGESYALRARFFGYLYRHGAFGLSRRANRCLIRLTQMLAVPDVPGVRVAPKFPRSA